MRSVIDVLAPRLAAAGAVCCMFAFAWKFALTAAIGLVIGAYLYLNRHESVKAWKLGTLVVALNLLALLWSVV